MQFFFEVADHLCTASVSTAMLNPALTIMTLTVNPPCPALTFAPLKAYQAAKVDMLRQATAVLGITPMMVEPPTPAMRSTPRPRRPAAEGVGKP